MAGYRSPDYEPKRAQIRATAARLFATEGFVRGTFQRIARDCRLNLHNIYYQYDNREAVLADITDRHMDGLLARLELEAPESLPGRDRLHALAVAYATFVAGAEMEHRAVLGNLQCLENDQQADLRVKQRWVLALFAAALEAAAPKAAGQAKVLALSLLAMLNAQTVWFREGRAVAREAYVRMAVEMVLSTAAAEQGKRAEFSSTV